jgi:hypothetical protein
MPDPRKKSQLELYASTETAHGRSGPCGAADLSQPHLNGFQVSAQPPAKTTADLIKKETNERRTSNIEH